jgi:hypothetical protein
MLFPPLVLLFLLRLRRRKLGQLFIRHELFGAVRLLDAKRRARYRGKVSGACLF